MMEKNGYTASLRALYFDFDDCSQRICCSVGKKKVFKRCIPSDIIVSDNYWRTKAQAA